jgi:hypothetical protein
MICGAFKRHNIARVAFPNAELIVQYVINVMTTAAILTAPDFAISWSHSSSWRTKGHDARNAGSKRAAGHGWPVRGIFAGVVVAEYVAAPLSVIFLSSFNGKN